MANDENDEDYASANNAFGKVVTKVKEVISYSNSDNKKSGSSKCNSSEAVEEEFVGAPREIRLKQKNTCWILSNRFETSQLVALPHYKIDERKITETFSWLNFGVHKKKELTTNKIRSWIKEICKEDYDDQECFVLFLLSHGNGEREILGVDNQPLKIDEIVDSLIHVKSLQGKPKLIFVQACRGDEDMKSVDVEITDTDMQAAASKLTPKAQKADIFVYFSTTQGYKCWVGSKQGSFFINKLCTVLQQYCESGKYHFGDVVTKVNDIISTHVQKDSHGNAMVQVSEACHTLTSKLWFNPKGELKEFKKTFKYKGN